MAVTICWRRWRSRLRPNENWDVRKPSPFSWAIMSTAVLALRVVEQLARSEWPTPMIAWQAIMRTFLMAFLEDEGFSTSGGAWAALRPCIPMVWMSARPWPDAIFAAVQAAFAARFPERHRTSSKRSSPQWPSATTFLSCRRKAGRAADRQNRDDLLNIRDRFLASAAEHGKLVVHGHTPSVRPRNSSRSDRNRYWRLRNEPPDLPCLGKRPAALPLRGQQ